MQILNQMTVSLQLHKRECNNQPKVSYNWLCKCNMLCVAACGSPLTGVLLLQVGQPQALQLLKKDAVRQQSGGL